MRKLHCLMCLVLLLFAVGRAGARQDLSNVEVKATRVSGSVYMLEGAGGNIGVSVGADGVLMIDDQYAPLAEKIRAVLKNLGAGPLKLVLNTHWHADHTGGNRIFGLEVPIIAHANVRKRLMSEQKIFGRVIPPQPREAWPVVTFEQSQSLHFNGEEIKVTHYPRSHTDGDSVVFFTVSNVIHMGDNMFAGRFPFVDLDSGGDVEGMAENIEAIIRQLPSDIKIIPGHGPLSSLDDLKAFHQMLTQTTDWARQRIVAGKTVEQMKAEGLPGKWQTWGTGFINNDRWIEILHRSLSRKNAE
jgi:cyclase